MDSPYETQSHHPTPLHVDRDRFHAGLLIGLAVLLLPAWRAMFGDSLGVGDLLAGAFLPAALGFLLVLRCKTVDLSVWAVMGAGGLVCAWVVNALSAGGSTPFAALPYAIGASAIVGAGLGGVNAMLLWKLPLPGFLVTGLVGLGVLGGVHLLFSGPGVAVPDNAFDPWVSGLNHLLAGEIRGERNLLNGPLMLLRMLVVFLAWTGVLAVLLACDARTRKDPGFRFRRWTKLAALCASGALAALSGACWLIDLGEAPVPTRLIDGLTIPVAAVLSGAIFLRGAGRTKLAVICLPPALLLTDAWESVVWPITIRGYSVSLAILGVMALTAQWSFASGIRHARRGRKLAFSAMVFSGAGMALLGFSSWFRLAVHRMLLFSALAAGLASLAMLSFTLFRARNHPEENLRERSS